MNDPRPAPCGPRRPDPAEDLAASRAAALVAGMTLREKVGQLNQRLLGWRCVERVHGTWRTTSELREEAERWGGLGALYGLFRADAWSGRDWATGVRPQERAEVAAMVVAEVTAASPHGIGPLLVEEAPHGHQALGADLLPVNLAVGAAWDPELYREASEAVSRALRADGVHLALVSALDLLRDPRWGRAEECYSEAPALAAALARSAVVGMQGEHRSRLTEGTGVGVVLKHFAAQGEGTGGRNGHSAHLGPRDLAALHLPAARAGVAAGALGLMAAYNDIDGVPCVASHDLLTRLLRGRWGFDGLVMADGLAVDRIVDQVGTPLAAAATALTAGVDLSLWDRSFTLLEEAVAADPALEAAVDLACTRVLTVKGRLGLLPGDLPAHPGRTTDAGARGPAVVPGRDAGTLSLALAARSVVMLTNGPAGGAGRHEEHRERVLPLSSGRRWAVTGPRADDVEALLGDYVPPLAPSDRRSVADALVEAAPAHGVRIERVPSEDVPSLEAADGVIVVLGGSSHRAFGDSFTDNGANAGQGVADCGEGVDLAVPVLPAGQVEALAAVRAATRAPVVAVVVAGRPYVLTEVLELADAVVVAFYPGPHGGEALADILLGAAQPVGRLPASLPAHPGVPPVRHDERMSADGVYRDVPDPLLRPLGAGIGYGEIGESEVRIEVRSGAAADRVDAPAPEGAADGPRGHVVIEAEIAAGPGTWDLEELLLVSVRRLGGLDWPRPELLTWRRVRVPAGRSGSVRLALSWRDLLPAAESLAPLARPAAEITVTLAGTRTTRTVTPDDLGPDEEAASHGARTR